ncbi:protein of unknown function [Azospirillum lipoferum 4B]|uniref:Uncharacterized protein n=1 Tax=Azospirillum lipoferum (strain 4B) TaxID=862719 RepID=G7Z9L6_AZOL4|nr:protein of unknown function [Azospirillum lipoferum 4B]
MGGRGRLSSDAKFPALCGLPSRFGIPHGHSVEESVVTVDEVGVPAQLYALR